MHKLKVGDVVQLKSGSPAMTVVKTVGVKVWTSWFTQDRHERALFPVESLVSLKHIKTKAGTAGTNRENFFQ